MATQFEALTPLPENVLSLLVSKSTWNGISVEVLEWRGTGPVAHRFPHETETRLITLLEEVGSPCEPRFREKLPCNVGYTPRHMDFAPAGLELWGNSADVRFVRSAFMTFDLAVLSERLAIQFDGSVIAKPRLRFSDERIWPLVKLLGEAVNDPDPSAQLYGDGLTSAIAARLLIDPPALVANGEGLAPWKLRRIVDYLDAHLPQRVKLAHLAEMADLSQPHFSRAFKASTGMAPYRWQLDARIRRAQALLLDTDASLHEVAQATGFADAVHFGRTFRKLTGVTPAAWRRDRKS
ncbi:MAG: AraC family transcriptional regulator [Hyphomicrobiaceae bacterium]|nr:AraC family transcriptional regulator [Hyphomicrobiaceae bacterium]